MHSDTNLEKPVDSVLFLGSSNHLMCWSTWNGFFGCRKNNDAENRREHFEEGCLFRWKVVFSTCFPGFSLNCVVNILSDDKTGNFFLPFFFKSFWLFAWKRAIFLGIIVHVVFLHSFISAELIKLHYSCAGLLERASENQSSNWKVNEVFRVIPVVFLPKVLFENVLLTFRSNKVCLSRMFCLYLEEVIHNLERSIYVRDCSFTSLFVPSVFVKNFRRPKFYQNREFKKRKNEQLSEKNWSF